jgi:hypothetical protein
VYVQHLRKTFVLASFTPGRSGHGVASCLNLPLSVNSAIGLIQCGYCLKRSAQFEERSSVILPAIPERVETFILTITSRRKAFTVFGLMFIRVAISLLVSP